MYRGNGKSNLRAMNYKKTLDFMFSQLPMFQRTGKAAYKANLDNTLALDAYFESPHKEFKSIHVAGTNGKGSVSHNIASVLQSAGYRVGLYTSPHLKDFRERIKINGEPISENEVVNFISQNLDVIKEIKPSFFEMTVALAFDYFARQSVEYAVIEVGLGGRLDSTNIITPILSVITNISLDHTNLLGISLEEIAKEKAGIIKSGIPVVVGEEQLLVDRVFMNRAKQVEAPITFASKKMHVVDCNIENDACVYQIYCGKEIKYPDLKSDLLGVYQQKNMVTTLSALDKLAERGVKIDRDAIYNGLERSALQTGLRGRWQILQKDPLIICDTGHNEAGIKDVIGQLNNTSYDRLHIVIGMVEDKNVETVLSHLPHDASYYFTRASIPRALDEQDLARIAGRYDLKGECYVTVRDALDAAVAKSSQNDLVFVGGSTFVVAEIV